MTVNQKEENQNGCSVPIEQPESGMESILDELQAYVYSQICRNCRFDDLVNRIIEEHEK